jgi:hypothetical protein
MADELLFGRLSKGGRIRIYTDGDKLRFDVSEAEEPVAS